MTVLNEGRDAGARSFLPGSYLPAIVALIVVTIAGIFADRQNQILYAERQRAEVLDRLGVIRAKLEGNINGNIQLVRGLVATLSTEPEMNQRRFETLAASLLDGSNQIRHIAAAPGLKVSLMYPLAGNEKAIGLDYNRNPAQREAALRARDSGSLVLAGPVDLVQGGRGFIGRFPVFISRPHGSSTFWGIVSAVVDAEKLYRESGLLDPSLPLEIAITGDDGKGAAGRQFFGRDDIAALEPVHAEVTLASGSWQLSAVPRGGWNATAGNTMMMRLFIVAAGILVVVPMLVTGHLIDERHRNTAELRRSEAELQRLSRRLDLALDTSKVGVWEFNIDTGELVWDDRMDELYGVTSTGGMCGYDTWKDRIHPDDRARAEEEFRQALEVTGNYNSDYRIVLPTGLTRHIRAIGAVYRETDGTSRIVGVNWDVTADVQLNEELRLANTLTAARNAELELAKARIEHNAMHDSLTGLPNRRYLDDQLDRASFGDAMFALLHIDLDRFKQINDTLGHAAGDAMLVHAATVLKTNIGPLDFVARVGGDEFVIFAHLVSRNDTERDLQLSALAARIVSQMRQPVMYKGHECRFGVSIGIASRGPDVGDPKRLMVNADIALYRAKNSGRNRYHFFNEALEAEIIGTKRLADDILNALEQDQFVPWYQPQFDAETLELTGVEALARWNHPERGLLAPDKFLKTAEELNVVSTIDRLVLERALVDMDRWAAMGLVVPKVSVNVSARRLNDEELIAGLQKLDIRPGTVSFELVESIFLDEHDDTISWNVDRIKDFGIDVEIDDFGTGYASIVSLMKLKPRRLKIDRQLVKPITGSPAQRQLVHSIIDIGKSLGIEVVAEGVETMEHARILRQLGCHALQGYAFAKAMSADDLVGFARAQAWRKAS